MDVSRPRRLIVGTLLALAAWVCIVPPVQAAAWYDGYCKDDQGVTVVIDYQALGGGIEIRCADNFPAGGTGFDALHRAGFTTQGTNHDGDGFVCRIAGRPSPSEKIPIAQNPNYRERCIDTPPAAGYWSYWHSTNGGSWIYSNFGVKNREAIVGGFEGWSFSLNATASTNPKPRVSPKRPVAAPTSPAPQPTVAPKPERQTPPQPGATASSASSSNTSTNGGSKATPGGTPTQRTKTAEAKTTSSASPTPSPETSPSASDPSALATPTGAADDPTNSPSPQTNSPAPAIASVTSGGPPIGTIVGLGVVVVLGCVAAVVMVRRRRFG